MIYGLATQKQRRTEDDWCTWSNVRLFLFNCNLTCLSAFSLRTRQGAVFEVSLWMWRLSVTEVHLSPKTPTLRLYTKRCFPRLTAARCVFQYSGPSQFNSTFHHDVLVTSGCRVNSVRCLWHTGGHQVLETWLASNVNSSQAPPLGDPSSDTECSGATCFNITASSNMSFIVMCNLNSISPAGRKTLKLWVF